MLIETIRRLVVRVVAHAEPGQSGFKLEAVGRLAEIANEVGHPFPPMFCSGGSLVAGGRYTRSHPLESGLFYVTLRVPEFAVSALPSG